MQGDVGLKSQMHFWMIYFLTNYPPTQHTQQAFQFVNHQTITANIGVLFSPLQSIDFSEPLSLPDIDGISFLRR